MDRRGTPGTSYGLVVIGLMASLVGFVAVTAGLADRVSIFDSFPSERIAAPIASAEPGPPLLDPVSHQPPGAYAAPVVVSVDPQPASPALSSARSMEPHALSDQGEAGDYLRDAAAVAKRFPWAGPWRGETRTDLWVNAPGSIGSTSPPDASPVAPAAIEE
jgi:hypothetical protein